MSYDSIVSHNALQHYIAGGQLRGYRRHQGIVKAVRIAPDDAEGFSIFIKTEMAYTPPVEAAVLENDIVIIIKVDQGKGAVAAVVQRAI